MHVTRMTSAMWESLQARLAQLEDRIAVLARYHDDETTDTAALLMHLTRERDEVRDALRNASLIDDTPFDEAAIEIGDTVTLQDDQGDVEQYVLVDGGVSSRVRDDWVSVSSPLGSALLGRGEGDLFRVESPAGVFWYRVLSFTREVEHAVAGPGG